MVIIWIGELPIFQEENTYWVPDVLDWGMVVTAIVWTSPEGQLKVCGAVYSVLSTVICLPGGEDVIVILTAGIMVKLVSEMSKKILLVQ